MARLLITPKRTRVVFFLAPLFLLLFLSGFGYERSLFIAIGGLVSIAYLFYVYWKYGKVSLPKGFLAYFVFLILFSASLFWARHWQRSFGIFTMFVSGGVFWVVFFNLRGRVEKYLPDIVLVLGVLFGLLALVDRFILPDLFTVKATGLVNRLTKEHHLVGDFWAPVMIFVLYELIFKKRRIFIILAIFGTYLLIMSMSRSAYLGIIGGVLLFLLSSRNLVKKYKKAIYLTVATLFILFAYAGISKSTLLSRPYFLQAVVGIFNNPFGVGVGNFGNVLLECNICAKLGLVSFSQVTHNLILEILVGMGVLGLSFIYWLYLVFRDVYKHLKKKRLSFVAALASIFIVFLFNHGYFVLPMFWLFFILLGIVQKEKEIEGKSLYLLQVMALYIMVAFLLISSFLVSFRIINIDFLS